LQCQQTVRQLSLQEANYGALFYTFSINGVPNRASGYFMDIDGKIPAQFEVVSAVQ